MIHASLDSLPYHKIYDIYPSTAQHALMTHFLVSFILILILIFIPDDQIYMRKALNPYNK